MLGAAGGVNRVGGQKGHAKPARGSRTVLTADGRPPSARETSLRFRLWGWIGPSRCRSKACTWLCDAGLRVTNLERPVRFYTTLLDLVELKRVADDESAYVLFKDRRSGRRLELNWYSEQSPFYTPTVNGEGLDHLEVRCRDVAAVLARLGALGVEPVNRTLWVNQAVVDRLKAEPADAAALREDGRSAPTGDTIAYVPDPAGNLICLYDHPEQDFDGPIPEHC